MDNDEIAKRFEFIAGILESRGVNPYRVQAYRNAADTLRSMERSVAEILETEGQKGLRKLPGIGVSLARYIQEYLYTGRMSVLDRVRGRTDPIALISTLPGVGTDTAELIYETLGVETLEELEMAAREGELSRVPGLGPKRIRGIVESLAGRLGPRTRREISHVLEPAVDEILDVDREYREKAEAGTIRKVAPKRFNPSGEAWLPVLNTRRGNHFYTALYSNTARAHDQGKTREWVVVYFDGPEGSGQVTVVTSRGGPLSGKRVIRGREEECLEYYEKRQAA
ncbi:MAG: helix-hairpin-helix domain-containing protein [Armatimonadota bacterium]|nr:DNA-binding protein [bacterium]